MANHSAHERLRAIIVLRGLSQSAAAKQLGISSCFLSLILSDQKLPGRTLSAVIESWTNGEIPAPSWLTANDRRRVARAGRAGKRAA